MKIVSNKDRKVTKHQQGGMVAAPEAAPAPEAQGQDPLMQLAEMAAAALQSQDCALAMQVCEGFMMIVEQAMGGGAAPVGAPQGEPVFKKGGVIARRNRK